MSVDERDIALAQEVWPEPWKQQTIQLVAYCAAQLRQSGTPEHVALNVLTVMAAAIKGEYGD